jgi:hypothetical protein
MQYNGENQHLNALATAKKLRKYPITNSNDNNALCTCPRVPVKVIITLVAAAKGILWLISGLKTL